MWFVVAGVLVSLFACTRRNRTLAYLVLRRTLRRPPPRPATAHYGSDDEEAPFKTD